MRVAEDIQRRLDIVVEGNEGLKRFMDHCSSLHLYLTHEMDLV
jgi:hypothetical protein